MHAIDWCAHHSQCDRRLPASRRQVTMRQTRLPGIGMKSSHRFMCPGSRLHNLAHCRRRGLSALLDEAWQWQLAQNPMFASQLGDRRYNDRWQTTASRRSSSGTGRHAHFCSALTQSTAALSARTISSTTNCSGVVAEHAIDARSFNGHLMPFSQRGGVQNLENNRTYLRFSTIEDYDDWLARLGKVDDVIEQTIDRAEKGRKSGYMSRRKF